MDYTLEDIALMLETDDDLDNILLILQLAELNQMASAEIPVTDEEDDLSEDDILSLELSHKSPQNDGKQKQAVEKDEIRIVEKDKLLSQLQSIIQSIKDRPREFLGDDGFAKINSLLGICLLPQEKQARSALGSTILIRLAKSKNKNIQLTDGATRTLAARVVNKMQKQSSALGL